VTCQEGLLEEQPARSGVSHDAPDAVPSPPPHLQPRPCTGGAPYPAGLPSADASLLMPASVADLMRRARQAEGRGDDAQALAAHIAAFGRSGTSEVLAAAHAALLRMDVNTHLLEMAARGLGREPADFAPLCGGLTLEASLIGDWLGWADRALAGRAGSAGEPEEALLTAAVRRLQRGAGYRGVIALLPSGSATRKRAMLVEAEALLRSGYVRRARRRFEIAGLHAPHVTLIHRQLGRFALERGDVRAAAGHFEAATMTPNVPSLLADRPDSAPHRIGTIADEFDIYRHGRHLYVVRRDARTRGVALVFGRLYEMRDTRGYKVWRALAKGRNARVLRGLLARVLSWTSRDRSAPRQGDGVLRRTLKGLRASLLRGAAWTERVVVSLLRRGVSTAYALLTLLLEGMQRGTTRLLQRMTSFVQGLRYRLLAAAKSFIRHAAHIAIRRGLGARPIGAEQRTDDLGGIFPIIAALRARERDDR